MKPRKSTCLLVSLLVLSNALLASKKEPVVFHPVGWVEEESPHHVSVSWPGSGLVTVVQHPHLSIELSIDEGGSEECYVGLLINGLFQTKLKVTTSPRHYSLHHLAKFQKGDTLSLIKLNESLVGLLNFHLSGQQTFNSRKLVEKKVIHFIGDSFTCGYGNELSIPAPPIGNPNTGFKPINQNIYWSWGCISARMLSVDAVITAISGRGLIRNNDGNTSGTMPSIWKNILAQHKYKTTQPKADVFVIHLGTNDFSKGVPDSTQFVSSMIRLVKDALKSNPEAHVIVCVSNGVSNSWPLGENRRVHMLNFLVSAVNVLKKEGYSKVHLLELPVQKPPYGEDWHPSRKTHEEMAEILVSFLKKNAVF